jgi:hypothetical protein
LDLLAIGSEINFLQRLLKYGASFAARQIFHSYGRKLQASVASARHQTDLSIIEGDDLNFFFFLPEMHSNHLPFNG